MKLEVTNKNYNAIVVKINNLIELDWCDNVLWFPIYWIQAIVSKDTKIWDIWILFWTEVSLSNEYCKNNNLYRNSENNLLIESKWYLNDTWRVKAVKFRWHKSSALFMPTKSLAYLNIPYDELKEWDSFNEINWIEICKKYIPENKTSKQLNTNKTKWINKKFEKITNKTLPEHIDTDNYFRNTHRYNSEDRIVVTQKLHWSSWRFWNCISNIELKRYEKLLSKIVNINSKQYESFYASRRVIKNGMIINNNNNYYKEDIWKKINERIKWLIPQDWIIYWEIIWRSWDKPIQKWYTYDLNKWEIELYVYRISIVNQQWIFWDLSWDAIKEFCHLNGFKYTPELWTWLYKDFDIENFMDKKYKEIWYSCIWLSDWCPCDEWIVIRKEWIIPYLTKAKCNTFLQYESKQIDSWEIDIESWESL